MDEAKSALAEARRLNPSFSNIKWYRERAKDIPFRLKACARRGCRKNERSAARPALGHSRPNEVLDFESALTSTPDIPLQRVKCREGPIVLQNDFEPWSEENIFQIKPE
jgi:hypothetical protein